MRKTLQLFTFFLLLAISSIAQDQSSGNFQTYMQGLIDNLPGESEAGGKFLEPNISDAITWENGIIEMLNGQYTQAHTTFGGIGYRVVEFTDNSSIVYYILERQNGSTNHWGIYVFNPSPLRNKLIIQSPHPKYDTRSGYQGVHVFKATGARMLYVSGTHRCNSLTDSNCSGETSSCGSQGKFRISDTPHNTNTPFHAATELTNNSISDAIFIQLHGFGKQSSDPYVILSNGTQIVPSGTDYLTQIKDKLLVEDNVLTFKIAHLDNWSRLIGTTNVQGRYINSALTPCTEVSPENNGRFIHIEQERTRLRDNLSGWTKMSNALSNVFPEDSSLTNTTVKFWISLSTVDEGAGSIDIELSIENPSATEATTVDITLTSGSTTDVGGYITQTVTFLAGSYANETVTINITDDTEVEELEFLTFSLQNVLGGTSASAVNPTTHELTIVDNEAPATVNIIINEIHADPDFGSDGDANGDGIRNAADDEFIELVNIGTAAADISGYMIYDYNPTFRHRHTFPTGTVVPVGGAIVIFGGGTPTGTFGNSIVQIASSGGVGTTNTNETMEIQDASGTPIIQFGYGTEGGNNQSITRAPDITGSDNPMVQHSTAIGSGGTLYSPGTKVDGLPFTPSVPDTFIAYSVTSSTVDEAVGTVDITLSIIDPSSTQATTVDVVLTSGNSTDIGNYTTQTVIFPTSSSANQTVTITVTDDTEVEPDEAFDFSLQNVTGGTSATAGFQDTFNLIITDNDVAPIADFASDVTSVTEGGTVSFSNLSTNANTWSWSFPGGSPSTSVVQNPQVVYNTAGIYDVTLTASNEVGSDVNTIVSYITVTVAGSCVTINNEDFESSWGIWNDGGNDARRSSNDAAYANSGSYPIRLRDNSSSSVMTTDNLDLTAYASAEISFSYITNSMDKSNEGFFLQISTDGGNTFTNIGDEWNLNDEFVNNQRYNETVSITTIQFTNNTQFRFRCDASSNNDKVYIDDVEIKACGVGGAHVRSSTSTSEDIINAEDKLLKNQDVHLINLYPNPANEIVIVDLTKIVGQKATLYIINLQGKIVKTQSINQVVNKQISIDLSELNSGTYLVVVKLEDYTKSVKKLLINR